MAITILNQPTTPNVTDTKLVYSITGSNVSQPQYQYITDIYETGGSTLLTRLFTYPNPAGSGIIEIGKILTDNLEYDNDWKIAGGAVANSSFKGFDIKFGEAYGTSVSSSITNYPNQTTSTIYTFPGTVDPNQGSFNWLDSGSLQILTNQTEGYLAKGNHVTFTYYANTGNSKTITLAYKNSAGTTVGGGTFTAGSTQKIQTEPIGSGSSIPGFESTDWETITLTVSGESSPRVTYNRVRPCNDEGVTFAFINHLGFYDYYSIPNPVRKLTEVERNTFDKPNVDYSSNTSIYNITNRGETQYNTGYTDRYEVTTEYVNKSTADWLTELFDSPEVYIQEDGNFIPVIINNTSYEWNMNENRQKLFQYTIQYQYANQRYDR